MQISDLNSAARRALERTVRLFSRAVTPRPPADPRAAVADYERGTGDLKVAAWRAVKPQPGEPRPPGEGEQRRRPLTRATGSPPPAIAGAGYIDLAWRFLDPDPEQQKLWASEEAKYGRFTTAAGPTPQAYSSNASVGLTIERLAIINQEASRDGYLMHKADLDFEIAQKWGHQQTAHRQRTAAVYRSPLQLRPRSKTDLGRFVCAFARGNVDEIPGFVKSEEELIGASRSGFSAEEVVWRTPRARRVTVGRKTYTVRNARLIGSLEWVHPRDFRWDPIKRRFLLDAGGTRYIDPFTNPDGSKTRKLVLHGGPGDGDPHQRGYAYATNLLYFLSTQSLSRWAVALEFFGVATPYLQYEGDGFADDGDMAEALAFLAAIGRGQPAVLHRKFGEVKLTETPTGIDARGQHAAILGYLNSECSKCVAGQTLTMEIGGSGSYAAANVQADSKEDVQIIDAVLEADTQTHQTIRYLIEENAVELARAFGGVSPADVLAETPIAYRVVDRRVDPKDRLAVFQGAAQLLAPSGKRIDPDQVAEELNLRLLEEDEAPAGAKGVPAAQERTDTTAADAPAADAGAAADAGVDLTATAQSGIITVDEAREKLGLGPWPDEAEGRLTVAEFMAKHSGTIADAANAEQGTDEDEDTTPDDEPAPDEAPAEE